MATINNASDNNNNNKKWLKFTALTSNYKYAKIILSHDGIHVYQRKQQSLIHWVKVTGIVLEPTSITVKFYLRGVPSGKFDETMVSRDERTNDPMFKVVVENQATNLLTYGELCAALRMYSGMVQHPKYDNVLVPGLPS